MIPSKLTAWNLGSHYLFNCYNCNSDRYLDWKRYCPELVQYVYLYNIFYIQNCPSYTKIMHSRSSMLKLISPNMEIKALFFVSKILWFQSNHQQMLFCNKHQQFITFVILLGLHSCFPSQNTYNMCTYVIRTILMWMIFFHEYISFIVPHFFDNFGYQYVFSVSQKQVYFLKVTRSYVQIECTPIR